MLSLLPCEQTPIILLQRVLSEKDQMERRKKKANEKRKSKSDHQTESKFYFSLYYGDVYNWS